MKKLILFSYFAFLIFVTFFSYIFIDPNLIYLKSLFTGIAFSQRATVTIVYLAIIVASFIFYLVFLNRFKAGEFRSKEFKLILGGTALVLLFSYPAVVSYDIFNYIATAKVLFFFHENPYLIMPIQFINDPLLLFTHAANKTALYGPVWLLISGVPYLLGFGNFLVTLFNFKFLSVLFYLGTIFTIHKFSKSFYDIALFAFNPLVLFEALWGSHNDIVMMFFALVSIYFLKEKKLLFSLTFLTLSILIKFSSVFLLPVFALVIFYYLGKKLVNWEKMYSIASLLMVSIFLLSFIREEIYPWYAVWFLVFVPLMKNRFLKYVYITFSFSLLLRDLPYMLLGTYAFPTPTLKTAFTFMPVAVVAFYLWIDKIWAKRHYL